MNSPAGFQGMGHYLHAEGVVEFFAWPFPPFEENAGQSMAMHSTISLHELT